ncbi:hypothetical protein [Dactylosporangium sp. CA-233914]|uniref:hypothetical protein n=1 Tax=Dactylosporangium sp. CA-233914 TaxID=3239934 RepID=UPI003D8C7398
MAQRRRIGSAVAATAMTQPRHNGPAGAAVVVTPRIDTTTTGQAWKAAVEPAGGTLTRPAGGAMTSVHAGNPTAAKALANVLAMARGT